MILSVLKCFLIDIMTQEHPSDHHLYLHSPRSHNQGIALVVALITMVIVIAMVVAVSSLTARDTRMTANEVKSTRLAQLADGISDRARLMLINSYKNSKLGIPAWLNKVSPCRDSTTCVIAPDLTEPTVAPLAGKHIGTLDGMAVAWQIINVSPSTVGNAWVQLAATAQDSAGGLQTVTRKVQFGQSSIFNLALLTKTVNCMFCHMNVNGDVGSYGFLRPGWGDEGVSGQGSGGGSAINGSVYAASTVTADNSGTNLLNDTDVTGDITTNYVGSKMPTDQSGNPAFPGLDRALAQKSASGSITGGQIQGVPIGGSYSAAATVSTVSKVYDGNLVLVGTAANPIKLDRDVYASGDVVIKGVIKGRGAIYAGRNIYVVGNLTTQNKADKPGSGVCASITDVDACAKANIGAGKDEVRLAAGNNVVLGDWTEKDASGNKQSVNNVQSADYFRNQFGLDVGTPKYVKKGTSEELELDASGKYVDALGNTINASQVATFGASGTDPYYPLMAPGATDSNGNFSQWMTDSSYQSLLGQENIPYNTWRTSINGTFVNGKTISGTKTARTTTIKTQLEAAGLPVTATTGYSSANSIASKIVNGTTGQFKYAGTDASGNSVSGVAYYDGSDLRVAVNESRPYKTETTQLDAFLYSNSRIAGKVSPRGGYTNGGMISREIGVLAPGKNGQSDWWLNSLSQSVRDNYNKCNPGARPTDTVTDAANNGDECSYSINYDYRLRNGGYGFNLITGTTGATVEWQFDQDGSKAVKP
jgi:hypothetical protein